MLDQEKSDGEDNNEKFDEQHEENEESLSNDINEIYLIFGIWQTFVMYLALTYLLIAITFVDIDHFIIPNGFVLIGIFMLILGIYTGWIPIEWEDAMSGSFVFAGFLFAIGLIGQFILRKEGKKK